MTSGEFAHGTTRTPRERLFTIQNKDILVRWLSIDFEADPEYINVPECYILCGVQYIPAVEPDGIEIRTSSKITENCQGLSALHEQLCMVDRVAGCADVEAMVLEAAPSEDVRAEYVAFRKVMFGVLVTDNPDNVSFARTLEYLESLE